MLLLDHMGLKEVLAKVDRKVLTVALKGTSEQLKNQMMACMSQRGAEMIREDMEALRDKLQRPETGSTPR